MKWIGPSDGSRVVSRTASRLALSLLLLGIVTYAGLRITSTVRKAQDPAAPVLASLIERSSTAARIIEPRLSGGFPWAPFRPARRAPGKFAEAIGAAAASVRGESTPDARHTEGIVELLDGLPREALATLSAAAASPAAGARPWNDLAVALHETSLRYDSPELLADGLAACDRALALEPQLLEALFNRALIIERLGLRDDARAAWEAYLAEDSASDWAGEARQHLARLQPEPSLLERLDRDYRRIAIDPAAARALVQLDPQEARGRAAMTVLARWGRAFAQGGDDAAQHLAVARALGAEVARLNGDRILASAVAAIDGADASTRAVLAAAYIDYERGLQEFQSAHPGAAEPLLRGAAARFDQARSPAALLARYFVANTVFEQGRHDEARQQLDALVATTPAEFPALRAQLLWQLGTADASDGDWGGALPRLEESAATFQRLGEFRNEGAVRRLIAFVYDRTGDAESAWSQRVVALRALGRRSDVALEKTVASIADAATLDRKWQTAFSFLTLQASIARRLGNDVQLADTLLLRAAVRASLEDVVAARSDVAAAEAANARVKEAVYRDTFAASRLRVRAMLTTSAPAAASLLTDAIAYQSTKSDRMELPALFLERARARRASGDVSGAAADLQEGIGELEAHRQSLPQGEARWGAFHAAEELFHEAIDLAIERRDDAGAFAIAERGRARGLLESLGSSTDVDLHRLPRKTLIVEFAALPSRLVLFTADTSGVDAVTSDCKQAVVTAEVAALSRALRANDSPAMKRAGAAVSRRLLEPIAARIDAAETIVFVTDAATSAVPFSALVDSRGDYLLERHALVVAPSAAAYVASVERQRAIPRRALVIASSEATADTGSLAYAKNEAARVASAYASPVELRDDDARFADFAQLGAQADVIHFCGHAIGDDSGLEPASIVLRRDGHEHRVRVAELARLRFPRHPTVVLAGCSTARGERRAAEGVISVAHGFLSAGAPSVIATLWPINDRAASILFPRLHIRLAAGLAPAEALRAVQLESIRTGDVPPSLWAALQNIGS